MSKRDYYEVLGIPRDADENAIKSAYRKLARTFHPDVNKSDDAEERFKEVNEAYEVLSDPDKRAAYDRYGHAATQGGFGAGGAGAGFGGFPGGFGDIFEEFFGGFGGMRERPTRPRARQRSALRHGDHLPGGRVRRRERDRGSAPGGLPAVPGLRRRAGHQADPLPAVQRQRRGAPGAADHPGPVCQRHHLSALQRRTGDRDHPMHRVPRTKTRARATRKLAVSIPAGVDDGMRIRLANEGEPGSAAARPAACM